MGHGKGCGRPHRENIADRNRLADTLPGIILVQQLESCRHLILAGRSSIATAGIWAMTVTVCPDANRGLARYGLEISAMAPVTAMPAVNHIVGIFGRRIVDVLLGT